MSSPGENGCLGGQVAHGTGGQGSATGPLRLKRSRVEDALPRAWLGATLRGDPGVAKSSSVVLLLGKPET